MEMERESGELNLQEFISAIDRIENLPENKRIDPNFFRNVFKIVDGKEVKEFPVKMIMGDLEEVEKIRASILNRRKDLSEDQIKANVISNFVEAMVPEAIKKLGWLGEKIKSIRPSLYDDYCRGIDNILQILPDEVVESEKDIKCIGISIDFTISEGEANKKMGEALAKIAEGKVPLVKYFNTNIITKDGKQNVKIRDFPMPRIIITCPRKIILESQDDLLNFSNNPDDTEAKEKAKETKLKYYFIRECLTQLEFFVDVAKRLGKTNAEQVYLNSLGLFKDILDEQGIDKKLLDKKNGKVLGLMSNFDLDANDGQLEKLLKAISDNN